MTLRQKLIGLFCTLLLLAPVAGRGQAVNPYYLNGDATQDNCNCYTLTPDDFKRAGSVWNINKIDLNQAIDFKFSVFLGNADATGADGIVFVLQPISTKIGSQGGGLGYLGVTPAIGITLDTWQNTENNDPTYDHIAIQANGDLTHTSTNNLAGPVTIIEGRDNAEDGLWHLLYIQWDPATQVLSASVDGKTRVSIKKDLIKDIFNNDPMVFWGFTASTGGAKNLQRFCTALNPGIASMTGKETCFGKPIQFKDSSNSFSRIVAWHWDFGDGSTFEGEVPPPHDYAAPGYYDVKKVITGNDGCTSDTFVQKIVVGTDPFGKFGYLPQPYCEGDPLTLVDSSGVDYGTVNTWNWVTPVGNFTTQNPTLPNGLPAGTPTVSLQVKTLEGCIASPSSRTIEVRPKPKADFTFNTACVGEPVNLDGSNLAPGLPITTWKWDLGDGRKDSSGNRLTTSYSNGKDYTITLVAKADNGCATAPITHVVSAYQTHAHVGSDTTIATGQSLQLHASGGVLYQWSPATYLSDPTSADPVARPDADIRYILTAYTPAGCPSTDTILIKVFKGPEIYVPTAFTPNGDGLNDLLHVIPIGVTLEHFRVFNRWGQLVFETRDATKGWDGLVKGSLNPGNYAWDVAGRDYNGNLIRKTGIVTVIH